MQDVTPFFLGKHWDDASMKAPKRAIGAVCGALCALALLCILSKLWPFIVGSLFQSGMQTRMHCWVKVVDQGNKGVKGYKCRVVEEHSPLWPFSRGKDVVRIFETRDDGSFEYTSKGATGRVFFGYSWSSQWTLNPQHLIQRRDFAVTYQEYQRAITESPIGYLGSEENPYLLHVFSVGSPQRLLHWKKWTDVKEAGRYACIDVLSGRIWESRMPEGDIAISEGMFGKNGELPRCFHYIVAGANCEVAPVLDDWGLCPPESGYQRELCAPRDWEARKWSLSGTPVYYRITYKNGMGVKFGRLNLISPSLERALVESYTNLQGERNLFYKGYTDLLDQKIQDFVSPLVQ